MTTPTLLNKADQGLLVDLIIKASEQTESVLCAEWYLELINKVKSLELEKVEFTQADFDKILNSDLLK